MRDILLTVGGGNVFDHPYNKHVNLDGLHPDDVVRLIERHSKDGVVFFHGGADVLPQLYGERNRFSQTSTMRDVSYMWVWHLLKAFDMPFMAVCGGHQFLTVMNGGTLYQDLSREAVGQHPGSHNVVLPLHEAPQWLVSAMNARHDRVVDAAAQVYKVNSTHHQATRNVPPNATPVAFAYDGVVEALLYDRGFTCQWHPEFYGHKELFRAVVERFE